MSLQLTIPYTTPGNYTYDSDKVEIDGEAKLLLQENAENFNEDFASDTGFTYDSGKSEFNGGQVQQKAQLESGETFRAYLDTQLNAEYAAGVATGTPTGGAAIASGYLDLKGYLLKYVDYAGASHLSGATVTGAIRFRIKPNYSGPPVARTMMFVSSGDSEGGLANGMTIHHDAVTGNLRIARSDSGGVSYTTTQGVWNPTAGTEYEFEVNWDLTPGSTEIRLFIDGVQFGATRTTSYTRDTNVGIIRVGNVFSSVGGSSSFSANFEIRHLQCFTSVQHTANYTPAALDNLYVEDTITLPAFSHSGPVGSTIKTFTGYLATESGSVRHTVKVGAGNWQWWNGSAWADSDGTYAQASSLADINSNIDTLSGADGATALTSRVHTTDVNTQASVSDLTWQTTAETTYPTDNPSVLVNSATRMDSLDSFSETKTVTGSDEVKYTIVVDGQDKYWSGAAWVNSAGTYAQANTAAEIETNKAALSLSGNDVKVKAFLHSDDGSTRPALDQVVLTYDFSPPDPSPPNECIVYGWVVDAEGDAVQGAEVLVTFDPFFNSLLILDTGKSTTTDSEGYWELSLVETATVAKTVDVVISYTSIANQRYRDKRTVTVPNQATVNYATLV